MATNDIKPARLPNMKDHALIGAAETIPVGAPTPVVSMSPVILPAPGRIIDLHLRVSAPTSGTNLPIILLSHGQGMSNNLSSLNGYGPLVNFFAAHGFVVLQPTHLSSKSLSLGPEAGSDAPLFWRSRVMDMKLILDHIADIEEAFPAIQGRLDQSRIAVVGHSMGGHTASLLLGARLIDPEDGSPVDLRDSRVKAGVLLAAAGSGHGGDGMTEWALKFCPFFKHHTYEEMATPTLVVMGDSDDPSHITNRGVGWYREPFSTSKGPKSLLSLVGGKHGLGGVSGYDTAEATDDESPERLAVTQRMTLAYLRSTLYPEDPAWSAACNALGGLPSLGKVESK